MTFTGSLNTFQSDKEHWMTDHKTLLPQLTERKLSVTTKTCHCSVPISALLPSSAFNCMSLQKVPLPCLYSLAESLSLHCFPSWCCWHLLRASPSHRLTEFWGRMLNVRVSYCVQFLPFRNSLQREKQIRDSYICAMQSSSPLGLLECAIIEAGLDGTPAAFPTGMELYLKLGLSLQFLPLSKLHSVCHHHEGLKLYILGLTDVSTKSLILIKLCTVTCRDKRVNRAGQDWLEGKELRYCPMVLLLLLRMRIRYVWGLLHNFIYHCVSHGLRDDK